MKKVIFRCFVDRRYGRSFNSSLKILKKKDFIKILQRVNIITLKKQTIFYIVNVPTIIVQARTQKKV